MKKCPELLGLLNRFREQGVVEFLRASQCGVNKGDPLVCCSGVVSNNLPSLGQPEGGSEGSESLPGTNVCGISKIFSNKVVNGNPAALGKKLLLHY